MRDPENLHHAYEYQDDIKDHVLIQELPEFDIPDYDLNDDKEMKKYLYDIENIVRTSYEYRTKWLKYLKDYVDMNQCSYFKNISNMDSNNIKIEIHHDPLSLFDIVQTVFNKRLNKRESLEVEMVAKEVMFNHYAMNIGVIPLSETVHELVHNEYLFIPTNKVYGNYKAFVSLYGPYIPQESLDLLQKIEDFTVNCNTSDYKTLLSTHFIYVNLGEEDSPLYKKSDLDEINVLIREKLKKNIKNQYTT